ncbi:MAG: hypothetical protein M3348_14560 [Acidobacteriota bacterium]|nr:hypothetical protein [Acidobacteriota bacterium]
MADEEPDKRMEFILEQQAQFAAQIGQLEGIVARLAKATLDRFESTDRRMDETDRRISALVDSQIRTEENIKNLTAVVDRYFGEGRNGRSDSES